MYNHIAEKKGKELELLDGISSVVAKVTLLSFLSFVKYSSCSSENCPHSSYFDREYTPVWKENNTGMCQLHLDSHTVIGKIYESVVLRDFHSSKSNLQWECGEEYRMSSSCPCAFHEDDSDDKVLAKHNASFCNGQRRIRRILFDDPPSILYITIPHLHQNADIGFDLSSSSVDSIQQSFKWARKNYVLATMILNNRSHFRSISLVGVKYILYDGMHAGNKLRWWNAKYVIGKQLNAYCISDLWYIATSELENAACKNSDDNVLAYKSSSISSTELSSEKNKCKKDTQIFNKTKKY